MVSKFEIIDTFNLLFVIDYNILNWENILSIGVRVPSGLGKNEGCSQCYFLALKCENLSA